MKNLLTKKILLSSLIIVALGSVTLFFINGKTEANAFDYLKPILVELKEGNRELNSKEGSTKEDFIELAEDIYSKYEGKKIKLNDFAILALTKISEDESNVYVEGADYIKKVKYRLFLAPYKSIDNNIVAFGCIPYAEYSTERSTVGNAQFNDYAIESNKFSPVDMVDGEMQGTIIIVDVCDEALIAKLEPIQAMYINKSLYNETLLDSVAKLVNKDPKMGTSEELRLNFLLNSVDLTVEFPKFNQDYDYRPINSSLLVMNLVEINSIKKLDSPGRNLFESHYSINYNNWQEKLPNVIKEYAYGDEDNFFAFDGAGKYLTVPAKYYSSAIHLGDKMNTLERTSLDYYSLNGYFRWLKIYPELGLKQIKPQTLHFALYDNSYEGTCLNGIPYDGIFKGTFGYTDDRTYFYMNYDHYLTESTRKAYEVVMSVFAELEKTPTNSSTIFYMKKAAQSVFSKGKCVSMNYSYEGKNLIVQLDENEKIINFTANWDAETTCVFNKSENSIDIASNGKLIKLSTIDGTLINPIATETTNIIN